MLSTLDTVSLTWSIAALLVLSVVCLCLSPIYFSILLYTLLYLLIFMGTELVFDAALCSTFSMLVCTSVSNAFCHSINGFSIYILSPYLVVIYPSLSTPWLVLAHQELITSLSISNISSPITTCVVTASEKGRRLCKNIFPVYFFCFGASSSLLLLAMHSHSDINAKFILKY